MEKERECVFDCCNQERGKRKRDIFSSSRERMRMCSFRPREGERAKMREKGKEGKKCYTERHGERRKQR